MNLNFCKSLFFRAATRMIYHACMASAAIFHLSAYHARSPHLRHAKFRADAPRDYDEAAIDDMSFHIPRRFPCYF